MSEQEVPWKITKNGKMIAVGVSALAAMVFSYFVYTRYVKKKRSGSSSSSSGDDTAMIQSIRRDNSPLKQDGKVTQRQIQQNGQSRSDQYRQIQSTANSSSRMNGVRNGDHHMSEGQDQDSNVNGGRFDGQSYSKRKILYFDSNDEMYFENEVSEEDLASINYGKQKSYTKVMLNATEEEKRKMREQLTKQKKQNIKQFLNDVIEKKGRFIHQKKRVFKEDTTQIQITEGILGSKKISQDSQSSTTQSDKSQQEAPNNGNPIRQEQFIQNSLNEMRKVMKNGSKQHRGRMMNNCYSNGEKSQQVVELSPHHFANKERNQWFDLFSLYAKSFLNDDEKNERLRRKMQSEKYYSVSNSKKRSASLD